jgi:hydrogenase expression/formation protein HypE
MHRLGLGKMPIEILDKTVLHLTGSHSSKLVTGPRAGVDFAAIRVSTGYVIVSSDPVTGVESGIGSYAVTVSANDVATSGNRPQFIDSVVLLPEGSTENDLRVIATDMDRAARRLGVTIVGGHTEVTPGLKRPIVAVTTFSFVKRFVSSEMAREGDSIMMTKTAGLEGTAVLASELGGSRTRLPAGLVARSKRFERRISIVEEAVRAFRTGTVHAMHDCTEGGVLGAAYEMSLASGLGFELWESEIPVAGETREMCERLGLDPLKLIGSGSLLIAVPQRSRDRIRRALRGVSPVAEVGRFTRIGRHLRTKDGRKRAIRAAPTDELWRTLARSA